MFAGQAAIVTCVLADGDAGATVIIRCALTMRLRSRDFAVPMDAKGCEVMAVCSTSVDDGARNPLSRLNSTPGSTSSCNGGDSSLPLRQIYLQSLLSYFFSMATNPM